MLNVLVYPLDNIKSELWQEIYNKLQNDNRFVLYVQPGKEDKLELLSWFYWEDEMEQLKNDYPELEEAGEFSISYDTFIQDYVIAGDDWGLYNDYNITAEEISDTITDDYYGSMDFFEELWNHENPYNRLEEIVKWAVGWCIGMYLTNEVIKAKRKAEELGVEIEFNPVEMEIK